MSEMLCVIKRFLIRLLPDSIYLKIYFKRRMGYPLNLNNPSTYNEKVNWMKLYDRNPDYIKMVDKYEAKKWAASIIGEDHIIKTYGVWDNFDDVNFDALPSKFVLKCTHDSGSVFVCKDKTTINRNELKSFFDERLSRSHYWAAREWTYKAIKPRIIAEEYIEDFDDSELRDYKFYCFNGKPQRLLLATDRQKESGVRFDYFDMNFKHLNLTNHWHPNAKSTPHIPAHFEEMKKYAEKLSTGIPQVRVDFYEANGMVLFGEMTFYDQGGVLKIHPDEWELEWGSMIKLPNRHN